jgi:hypothetical protein
MFRQTGADDSLSDRVLSDRIIFENLHFNTAIQSLSTPSQIDAIAKRFQLAEESLVCTGLEGQRSTLEELTDCAGPGLVAPSAQLQRFRDSRFTVKGVYGL